jgi:intracellular septation protein A
MRMLLQSIWPLLQDLVATVAFAGVVAVSHNPALATGLALALGGGQLAIRLARRKPTPALQWASLGMVAVFGAASLATHDLRFMMFKPSVVYAVVGISMLQPGWLRRYMPERVLSVIPGRHIRAWGQAWAALLLATAGLNAGFALMTDFATWTRFLAVFPLVSKLSLFGVQYTLIRRDAGRRWRAQQAQAA